MRFYVGLHHPSHAQHFERCFVSVNVLRQRRGTFPARDWILDSGAFTEITTHGRYRHTVEDYAAEVRRWVGCGHLLAAVAQDFMCEPFVLEITGGTVASHQRQTIERYDALLACDPGVYVMPVLQGYAPADYASHVEQYGKRLQPGAWVGVGSVCKRNGKPSAIEDVLRAVRDASPKLELHGFGLKTTALGSGLVRTLLASADSMAWSYSARMKGRDGNDWREAERWVKNIEHQHVQWPLFV